MAPATPEPDVVARFALARARFIGAPWVRRSDTPLIGISGSVASPTGTMFAAVISTEDVALGYTSPPGVTNEPARNDNGQPVKGLQINEKSLRVVATSLDVGERAEAYQRFPSGAQNLLKYEQVRVWFRGNGDGWTSQDLTAFFKIGSDDRNFYLYNVPASSTAWVPEALISIPDLAPAPRRHRAAVAAGPPARRGGGLRHRRPAGLRGLPGALRGPGGGPRRQPAEPGLRAGALRRHLPAGQHRRRSAPSSSGWTTSGSTAR